MKLGQQVRFKKFLSKAKDGVSYGWLSEEIEKELEDNCLLRVKKMAEKECNEYKNGIVVGKRKIGIETILEEALDIDGDPVDRFCWRETIYDTVFLVACDLKGLYRVREIDLEEIT